MTQSGLRTAQGAEVPLLGVEVVGEVVAGHSRVKVRQRYRNGEARAVEAIYVFPLPSAGTLVGFAMIANGRRMDGVVKEREAAFRAYDDAIAAGHGAALLEQERKNVFTASIGNLLPGEETLIEVEYVERVHADQGAIRWMIPTLVAPRYVPGTPAGDRTAHGAAEPTDRVPDADRISPRIGEVAYGLRLDLTFDLGAELEIESPSHRVVVTRSNGKTRVAFARDEVALDRDVVVIARGVAAGPLVSIAADAKDGVIALTIIPDLGAGRAPLRHDVCFLIDTSGSMAGASIDEARAALRLCLRHLREGDRFNIIAFNSGFTRFAPQPAPFGQRSLDDADAWVRALHADGGTELLAPMLDAVNQLPDGIIVLLTDGQVANEAEILKKVLGARRRARVYAFGIGTNISDVLLRDLAERTGGAVEQIHPGERIDEKVVAQFARALAPRVENLKVIWDGVDVSELAPAEPPTLVDGEPWTVFGRVTGYGSGKVELRGSLDGQAFHLSAPIDLRETTSRPGLAKLWAAARIAELEAVDVSPQRAERMKERIVALAVVHQVACQYTSFVVVEERTGERRMSGQPETRAIPVNAPAGWDMFDNKKVPAGEKQKRQRTMMYPPIVGGAPMQPPAPAPKPAPPMTMSVSGGAGRHEAGRAIPGNGPQSPALSAPAKSPFVESPRDSGIQLSEDETAMDALSIASAGFAAHVRAAEPTPSTDPVVEILGRQLASGLWDEPGQRGGDDARVARATARTLLALHDLGVDASHALHGSLIKKAVAALLGLAGKLAPREAQLAVGVAWLVSLGGRSRREAEALAGKTAALAALTPFFADEEALRRRVDSLM